MSREVFFIKLSQVTLTKEGADQVVKTTPIFIGLHHIQALVPGKDRTTILTTSGVAYEVTENPETIERMGSGFGTFKLLK